MSTRPNCCWQGCSKRAFGRTIPTKEWICLEHALVYKGLRDWLKTFDRSADHGQPLR